MTDAFADLRDEDSADTSPSDDEGSDESVVTDSATFGDPSENTVTTVGESDTTDEFADGVRSTLPDDDGLLNDDRYEDEETGEKADDVDPPKLFRTPTLDELRYYYREGPYGGTIVEKPVKDAFKHGFEIKGDYTEREKDDEGTIKDFLDEYVPYYVDAKIKSRRDGVAVLQFYVGDDADSAAEPIDDGGGNHEGFHVWTVDSLSEDLADATVAEHTEYDEDQVYVTEGAENGGVALVDDIQHPDHGDVIGYGIEPRQESENTRNVSFLHADRCQHFVHGEHVDGPLGNTPTGKHVGESVLTPVLQPLKAAQMGFWAIKHILYRYSAPLHAVEPPESWGKGDWDDAQNKLGNISMASDTLLPPGAELNVAEGSGEFNPQDSFSVLIEAICAGTVFTKSVLQGTQTGTVSGSETDVKGYFSGVQRNRQTEYEREMRWAVQKVASYDQQTVPRVASVDGFEFDWGPLFKPTSAEQAEGAVSLVTAATNAIKSYVLTPDEARSLVEAEWAEFDVDVDLDELSEADWDDLDRINMNEAGRGRKDNEPVNRENPQLKNGGGQPEGQTRESSQPARDDELDAVLDDVSDEELGEALRDQLTN